MKVFNELLKEGMKSIGPQAELTLSPDEKMIKDLIERLNDKTLYYEMNDEARDLLIGAVAHVGLALALPGSEELLRTALVLFRTSIENLVEGIFNENEKR